MQQQARNEAPEVTKASVSGYAHAVTGYCYYTGFENWLVPDNRAFSRESALGGACSVQ